MKKTNPLLFLLTLAFMLSPVLAYAANLSDVWNPPSTDKSLFYLLQIFGTMGTVLSNTQVGANVLIANLFKVFNIAVLTLGSLTVSYTIVVSVINTSQEGEAMGKKWSSVWIPFRSAMGMMFLIPTAGGYSIIQIMMMKFVVLGVGAADILWNSVMNSMQGGAGIFGTVTISSPTVLYQTSTSLLKAMTCQEVLNSDPSCQSNLGNASSSIYTSGNNVYVGVPNTAFAQVCGSFTPGAMPNGVQLDPTEWNSANVSALLTASAGLGVSAAGAIAANFPNPTWSQQLVSDTANQIQASLIAVQPLPPTDNGFLNDSIANGWLFAGSYYFELVNQNQNLAYNPPTATAANLQPLLAQCATNVGSAMAQVVFNAAAVPVPPSVPSSLNITAPPGSTTSSSAISDAITAPVRDSVYSLFNTLTNSNADPIISLRNYGQQLMSTCEIIWFTVIILSFALMGGACIMSGMQPACYAVGIVISILVPALTSIITLLWGAGAAVGIYLPLVPYMVFTFTALGWMVLVIETIAAAPIVALGLVSPSAEHMGKAAPAITLIANVFMRPSLMVIGLMVAIKLVRATVSMVNFGFTATVSASVHGIGLFGCIALIYLYCGLILAVINESFSLIHVLPDKIIRWIGGQAESSGGGVKEHMGEMKQTAEGAMKAGSDLMKGVSDIATDKAKGHVEKYEKDKAEGKDVGFGKGTLGATLKGKVDDAKTRFNELTGKIPKAPPLPEGLGPAPSGVVADVKHDFGVIKGAVSKAGSALKNLGSKKPNIPEAPPLPGPEVGGAPEAPKPPGKTIPRRPPPPKPKGET